LLAKISKNNEDAIIREHKLRKRVAFPLDMKTIERLDSNVKNQNIIFRGSLSEDIDVPSMLSSSRLIWRR
jgi:hypothetical protein